MKLAKESPIASKNVSAELKVKEEINEELKPENSVDKIAERKEESVPPMQKVAETEGEGLLDEEGDLIINVELDDSGEFK